MIAPDDAVPSAASRPFRRRPGGGAAGSLRRIGPLVRRHRAITALVAVGALLRLVAMLGFRPALWFNDAFEYVSVAEHPKPYAIRPNGYSWFLDLLLPFHSVGLVVAVQHVLGLVVGVVLYAIVRSFRLPAWAGCLAAAPVLLDSFQILIEHILLSDTLFTLLLVAVAAVLLTRPVPSVRSALVVGLLLAAAMLTRPAALPVIVIVALFLLVRRSGWKPLVALVLAVGLPLLAYGGWYRSEHGAVALANSTGIQLYGRVAGFADCARIQPAKDLAVLCPAPYQRGKTAPAFIWHDDSPLARVPGYNFSPAKEKLARRFAQKAILAQPGDYLRAVGRDVRHGIAWHRGPYPNDYTVAGYFFSDKPWPVQPFPLDAGGTQTSVTTAYEHGDARTRVVGPWSDLMIDYQHVGKVPGTVLFLLLLIGAVGFVPRTRRGGPDRPGLLLAWGIGLSLALVPILTVQLDYRYLLPSTSFAALAAVLAVARLAAHRRAADAEAPAHDDRSTDDGRVPAEVGAEGPAV